MGQAAFYRCSARRPAAVPETTLHIGEEMIQDRIGEAVGRWGCAALEHLERLEQEERTALIPRGESCQNVARLGRTSAYARE